ncbi:MAG: AbrB/MazE/SpoVT family DNA-binding domain-containing protein [Thermodesulfovibrionales bacterium]|nr:AbrB/MazE/SpoVT family DNA-binding domain-containing protein [Thermodesulfovibrionales bacterium]
MPVVKLRERGQVTIPYEYRKDLGLGKEDVLNVLKIGDVLILVPRQLAGDALSRKIESTMKKKGLTLDNLLSNLRDQRKRYSKETYAKAKA